MAVVEERDALAATLQQQVGPAIPGTTNPRHSQFLFVQEEEALALQRHVRALEDQLAEFSGKEQSHQQLLATLREKTEVCLPIFACFCPDF